jgi:hypothetical protein
LLLFDFFNLYFYIIILRQLLLYARVCVYCLVNLICSFFFFIIIFSYYFSITFPIRLIAQGCVFFFLCECSFLVNRLTSKRKKNKKKNSICFVFFFFISFVCGFFLIYISIFSVLFSFWLIKQNRFG